MAAPTKRAARYTTALVDFEPTGVRNLSVKEYESEDMGTSSKQGDMHVSGKLQFKAKGMTHALEVPVDVKLTLNEHPHSGHLSFSEDRSTPKGEMVIRALLGGDYKAENKIMKMLGRVEFVPYDEDPLNKMDFDADWRHEVYASGLKLAASMPKGNPTRRKLLALLKESREALGVGKTVETKHLRIHRYMGSLRIWDLTNAGRRGKRVDIMAVYDLDYLKGNDLASAKFERWLGQVLKDMTYPEMKRTLLTLLQGFERASVYPMPKFEERQEKGVRVDPPETVAKRLKFTILDTPERVIHLEAKPSEVRIRETVHRVNDRGERQFYIHDTLLHNTRNRSETKALYNWVLENERVLKQQKTLADIRRILNDVGVPYNTTYLD
jgi:hypothetical protein